MSEYELIARRAESSALEADAEPWKPRHEDAMRAWLVNDSFVTARRLLQALVELDDASPPSTPAEGLARERALRTVLRLCKVLAPACDEAGPERYGYSATRQQVEQVEGLARAMLRGVKVYDAAAERRALEEAAEGRATTLEQLRARHP